MTQPTSSGAITATGDLTAHTVNTGYIAQQTQVTLNVMVQGLEHLADRLAHADGTLRLTANGALEAVAGTLPPLQLPPNLLDAWRLLPRALDAEPQVQRRAYAAWLLTAQPLAPLQVVAAREHYVPLAGWMSLHDLPLTLQFTARYWVGDGPQRQLERVQLTDVTQGLERYPACVLLGPPGCGKSTVLRRLVLNTARAVLTGQDSRLPVWINLAHYTAPQPPLDFLAQYWHTAGVPGDFVSLVRAGEVLLLADGLNEMERLATSGALQRRANAWQGFLETYFSDPHNHSRALLASRDQADYTYPLGLPRVEIAPLHDEQITAFLQAYLGAQAAEAEAALRRLELLEHARNPYQLAVLAALYAVHGGDLPSPSAGLFAQYAAELLRREEHANHPHWLPVATQLAALSHLGYAMQAQSESTVLSTERLLALLPETVQVQRETVTLSRADVFDLACRAGVLSPEATGTHTSAYKFSHQLLQESFAAHAMLARWQAGTPDVQAWWQSPRTHRDMPPANVGAWDPLPPPDGTGWERVTMLAAGMTEQPEAFVQAVLAVNPTLAGRCVSEATVPISPATRQAVQQTLLADLGNPAVHRRARLAAGRVLGAVGDPRLTPQEIGGVQVILPDLVAVPGGTARLGSARWPWDRRADANERPRHHVPIAPFFLGRLPVTNTEYACFMQAGGYDTARYWTPTGWQWRHGATESSGPVEELLEVWQYYRQHPADIDRRFRAGRLTPGNADAWRTLIRQLEEDVRASFLQQYPTQPHNRPHYWHDPERNAPNQPVVGVTWYEAMAYCAWLQAQGAASSQPCAAAGKGWDALLASEAWEVRLLTEAEWEWAAGGRRHRRYPWGQPFTVEQANTLEGRVMAPSPVGAYPAGAAEWGALDMSGNVWEWTHSLYQPYPYRSHDGREQRAAAGRRTLRGGAWLDGALFARASARVGDHPDVFDVNVGLRVAVAPVLWHSGS